LYSIDPESSVVVIVSNEIFIIEYLRSALNVEISYDASGGRHMEGVGQIVM